jgi:hypothetical protein
MAFRSLGLIRSALFGALVLAVSVLVASRLNTSDWSGRQVAQLAERGIYVDGWLRDEAAISLGGFSTVANVVELTFEPTRLAGDGPPRVSVSVCGAPPQELSITQRAPYAFRIPSGCSPISVSIKALNTFVIHEKDEDRTVGTQIYRLRVTSALGFPLMAPSTLASVLLCVALLALCAYYAPGQLASLRAPCLVIAMAATLGMVEFGTVDSDKYFPLYLFAVALLGGMAMLYRVPASSDSQDAPMPLVWLFAIVAGGAALRFYGIDFGLPAHFHPDEVPKVNAIMRMVEQKTLNPQYFLHPSLLLYCTYFVNVILQAIGFEGSFRDTAFLAGRIVSAIAGTLSIALTYEIGRRLISRNVGLVAAAFLAVFPLHVTCSRYLKEDALLTFVTLSCILATLVAVQSKRRWVLLIAGFLAGATAGAKYSGILLVIVPASAPWLASRSWKPDLSWLPWSVAAVCVAPLGFLATTPYALLDQAKFLKDFAAESRHMQLGHTNTIDPWSQLWMYHFYRSILPGLTPVIAIASVVGLGFLLRRGRIEDLFVVSLALLFYLPAEFVKAKPAPQPERYILPCVPFLAIALAQLVRSLGRYVTPRHGGAALCSIVLLVAPAYRTLSLARDVRVDTRQQLAAWMKENIPAGSTVLMDWKPYCPQLNRVRFKVEHIQRARIIPELDPGVLRNSGADYLILSSLFYGRYFNQPESNPVLRQRIREVFDTVPVVSQYQAPSGSYGFHNPVLTLFSLKKEDFASLDEERSMKRRGQIAQTSNEARARPRW